jgi:Ca2+/Na+ antiporter
MVKLTFDRKEAFRAVLDLRLKRRDEYRLDRMALIDKRWNLMVSMLIVTAGIVVGLPELYSNNLIVNKILLLIGIILLIVPIPFFLIYMAYSLNDGLKKSKSWWETDLKLINFNLEIIGGKNRDKEIKGIEDKIKEDEENYKITDRSAYYQILIFGASIIFILLSVL